MGVDYGDYFGTDDPMEISNICEGTGLKMHVGSQKEKRAYSTAEAAELGWPEAIAELEREAALARERRITPEQKRHREYINNRSRLIFYSSFPLRDMLDAVREIDRYISCEEREALIDEIYEAMYQHNKHMEEIKKKCQAIEEKNRIPDEEIPF